MDNFWLNALWSVIPTILVGMIFWLIVRSVIRADRTERAVYNEMMRAERERLGLPPETTARKDTAPEA